MKAMGRNNRSYSVQLSLTEQIGKDGYKQVQLRDPKDLRGTRKNIVDQLQQETTGVVLISDRVMGRGEVKMAMADPSLDFEGAKNTLFER
jgi:hypothetical protein